MVTSLSTDSLSHRQPGVISDGSCYLTSYGYLAFYRFPFSTRSVNKFPSCVQLFLVLSRSTPHTWGTVLLRDFVLLATYCGSRGFQMFFSGRRAILGTLLNSDLFPLWNLWNFPAHFDCSLLPFIPSRFSIFFGFCCLVPKLFSSFPRLSQSNFLYFNLSRRIRAGI